MQHHTRSSQPQQSSHQALLAAAVTYARRGWHIFPVYEPMEKDGALTCSCGHPHCGSSGKHPRRTNPAGQLTPSADQASIARWWLTWRQANIGVLTGARSGMIAIDADNLAALAQLRRQYDVPRTLTARSGGGGLHVYFATRGEHALRSTSRLLGLRGLEVKGEGAQLIVPPSRHWTGGIYRWLDPTIPLAAAPTWLCEMLTPVPEARRPAPFHSAACQSRDEAADYWLCRAVQQAELGLRNQTGFWLALQLRDAGLTEEESEPILVRYAREVGADTGSGPYTEREARATLRSAYRRPPRQLAQRERKMR